MGTQLDDSMDAAQRAGWLLSFLLAAAATALKCVMMHTLIAVAAAGAATARGTLISRCM